MLHAVRTSILFALLATATACCSGAGMGGFGLVDDVPEAYSLGAVWSFGPEDVWVTADGGRVFHYGGNGWDETQLETNEMMLGLWGFAPDNLWAVGGRTLACYDGTGWEVTDLRELEPGIEGLSAIWASTPEDVWVVGSQSTAAHFDGESWRRYLAAGSDNTVVWGSGPNDVYTASVFSVAHFDGSAWSNIETGGFSSGAEGIWGFGPDDVWISDGDELAHFDGSDWEIHMLDFIAEAESLWGLAPDDLWGVGSFGGILHYDGRAWHEVAHQRIGSPYLRMFHDVHGSKQGDVWVIGTQMGEDGVQPKIYRRAP